MLEYNDYELLYLISEDVEEAQNILIEKYIPLINKRILSFQIDHSYYDDFMQEGLMVLLQAIDTFDENKNKSFTKFFDMILQMKFGRLLKNEYDYYYNVCLYGDSSYIKPDVCDSFVFEYEEYIFDQSLSKLERDVKDLIMKGYKPKEISAKLNIKVKCVYNTICRLKLKKENMN